MFNLQSFSSDRTLIIGGGFTPDQLMYIIPIAHGYSSKSGIKTWILEDPVSEIVSSAPGIASILASYKIFDYSSQSSSVFKRLILRVIRLTTHLPSSLILALQTSRQSILLAKDWYEIQKLHSVWDSSLLGMQDGRLSPSLFQKIASSLFVNYNISRAFLYLKRYQVTAAMLAHNVYGMKAFIAALRTRNVDIFVQAEHSLVKLPRYSDYIAPSNRELFYLMDQISDPELLDFWSKRKLGISTYSDANINFARSTYYCQPCDYKNYIFLHVFRDSPFHYIDSSRVYADYFHWIINTLLILKDCDNTWLLRPHPSATRWGEDQMIILQSILSNLFGEHQPANIKIDRSSQPNIDVYKKARRIVTFNGSTHLEAACWGIKPIVVSTSFAAPINLDLLHLPRTHCEYRDLLLCSSDSRFSLSEDQIQAARKLLFIREEVLPLTNSLPIKNIYKGDPPDTFDQVALALRSKLHIYLSDLDKLGALLASGATRTLSLDYISLSSILLT
jgi:hypothetical protein